MWKSKEQIVKALHDKETTLKSVQNSVSRYRQTGDLDRVILLVTAIETYKHQVKFRPSF